mgnify:CR=1 FL=1
MLFRSVARGVRRTRDADRGYVVGHFERVEVDVVLMRVLVDLLDLRQVGDEIAGPDRLIGVADVLRHQGKEDAPIAPLAARTGEEVEEDEEGRLAAVGDRDVLLGEVPAELPVEHAGHRGEKGGAALRRVVLAEDAVEPVGVVEQRAHLVAPDTRDVGNQRRIAAAEHVLLAAAGQRPTEVVHEPENARFAGESPPGQ